MRLSEAEQLKHEARNAEMRELVDMGLTYALVGEMYGISRQAVHVAVTAKPKKKKKKSSKMYLSRNQFKMYNVISYLKEQGKTPTDELLLELGAWTHKYKNHTDIRQLEKKGVISWDGDDVGSINIIYDDEVFLSPNSGG